MPIKTYISTITSNENGLNVPTKKCRLAEWMQKTRPKYMVPSDLETHTDWNLEDGKRYFMQMEIKSNPE